jgi:hypothetical protein
LNEKSTDAHRLAIPHRDIKQKDGSGGQMVERMIAMSTTPNLASIKPSLDKLQALERELMVSLIERDEVIRASLVALLAGQHLVVLDLHNDVLLDRPAKFLKSEIWSFLLQST